MATRTALTLGAVLLGAAGIAGYSGASHGSFRPVHPQTISTVAKCGTGTPTLTIQGNGSATAAPDEAMIGLGVQTQAATAAAAMSTNSIRANALVVKLEADGVAQSDLQTSNLSVQPNYNNNGTVITGYQVSNDITVTLHNVAGAGKIIDDAASVAGNAIRVEGITFAVPDQESLMAQARAAAVRQAASQAQVMAAAAGLVLGPLCSLQDNSSITPPQPLFASGAPAAMATTTPVETGSLQVTANITAVYELGPGAGTTTTASSTE